MTHHRCRIVRNSGLITVEPDTYPAALVVGKQALLVMDPRAVVLSTADARELLDLALRFRDPDTAWPDLSERLADAIAEARP
jgi:hypothetical protein